MFYRSLFTNAFTACALFSGEIALADSFNISNDDSSAYSLINSLGEPLNAGNAINPCTGIFRTGFFVLPIVHPPSSSAFSLQKTHGARQIKRPAHSERAAGRLFKR